MALLVVVSTPIAASFQLFRSVTTGGKVWTLCTSNNVLGPFDALPSTSSLVLLRNEDKNKYSEGNGPDDESLVGEQFESSVDWDAEWIKVVEDRDQPPQRPGKYKSQAEIAAIKATNKVAKNVFEASQDMKSKLPQAPSIRSLQGDWKFWIGIIVILSFGLSILSVAGQTQVNDSFYI